MIVSLGENLKSRPLLIGIKNRRHQMALLMLTADLLGFSLGTSLVLTLNQLLNFFVLQLSDLKYLIVPVICILLFVNSKLYPGIGINPAEEIRLVTQFISSGFLIGLIFYAAIQSQLNIYAIVVTGVIFLPMVLLMRWAVRILAVQLGLWGEAVAIIAPENHVEKLTNYFLLRRRLGFVPVLAATESVGRHSLTSSVPVIDILKLLGSDGSLVSDIQTVVVDFSAVSGVLDADVIGNLSRRFRHIIFVSDIAWLEGITLCTHDFEGLLGIEVRKNILNSVDVFIKRVMDIVLSLVLGLFSLPILILAALAIRLDSSGSIFFVQERLGKAGRKIKIYKFRTMLTNADRILEVYLQNHPQAARDWERHQKLRDDPRITRSGKWLRRFSIDELPQLFNVLKGEMSLVGPRPMMTSQSEQYGDKIVFYYAVHPGLTGMWQVSGRNQTTFEERAQYDLYYVRNWSIWLDIYILARTVWVVLRREGAY